MSHNQDALWSWTEIGEALGQELKDGPAIHGISIDSRTLDRGDLFVALSGKARPEFNVLEDSGRDGHEFVSAALDRGASGLLVHEQVPAEALKVVCEDTLDGLWELARYRRAQLQCPVVAITGSSGKTTMKSFAQQALQGVATAGSLNNHIGLPLSIVRTSKDASSAVLEIGTNHPGEIAPLSRLARPHVAVVLNVLNAHIGNFQGEAALRTEKLSIGEGVVDGGHLVVYEPLLAEATERFPNLTVVAYGDSDRATYRYQSVGADEVVISTPSERREFLIPGGGEHRAATLCATGAVLDVLGKPLSQLELVEDELPAGRGLLYRVADITIVDESYNANPESMRKCLQHLAARKAGRRIAILGAMAELGDETETLHRSLVADLKVLDGVISVGEAMNEHVYSQIATNQQWGAFEDIEGLVDFCLTRFQPDDVVMVKGSNTVFWTRNFVPGLVQAFRDKWGGT